MRRKIGNHLCSARYKLTLLILAAALLAFSFQRLLLYLFTHADYAGCSMGQIATAFLRGLRFDLVAAAMLAAPFALLFLLLPPIVDRLNGFRMFLSFLAGFVLTLILFVCTADFFFFLEFGARLDIKVLQYFHYDYIHKIVIEDFHAIPLFAVCGLLLIGLGVWVYKKIFPAPGQRISWLANLAGFFLIAVALALSIRGSVGPKAINTGPAYFSQSNRLAQLTLNGLFTIREAAYSYYGRKESIAELYPLLAREKAFRTARKTLKTKKDRFVDKTEQPVMRVTDTGKPQKDYNVVLVMMESMSWPYIQAMGGMSAVTPNLNRLIRNGIFMENCFSVGTRTTRGVSGIIAGFPDLPGESITTRENSVGEIRTIGSILENRGYNTMFVYAGQPYYDHRQSFLGSNGFTDFVFAEEFPQTTFANHLGWCDEDLFLAAHKEFTEQEAPFFATLLTLSFHRDYNIPEGKIEPAFPDHPHSKQIRCIQYMDWAIGRFMQKARKAGYFEDTIFVFTADHCGGFLSTEPEPAAQRIPFLIYAPDILGSRERCVEQVCSQTDIAPTIMALLGGRYRHSFFGSDVLSRPPAKGGALLQDNHGILSYIDSRRYMVRVVPHEKTAGLYRFHPPDTVTPAKTEIGGDKIRRNLKNRCISLIQTAAYMYHKQTYQPHDQVP